MGRQNAFAQLTKSAFYFDHLLNKTIGKEYITLIQISWYV